LSDARATISALKREMARQQAEHDDLHQRQAYKFARRLVEVKANPLSAWKLAFAAAALATPKPVRERARRAIQHAQRILRAPRRWLHALSDRESRWPTERPLVSVVVPCFNYGAFVGEAVDAALRQTLQDVEVIVVEGGSTDGSTRAAVEALDHPRVRKVFQPRPARVGENRVAGLNIARGKYVVFLDADDLLEPTYLEKAVMVLELTGVDIAYPSVRLFGRDDRIWETGDEFTLSSLAVCNMIPTVAMFRLETWRRLGVGYGTDLDLEDYDFWLRFATRGATGLKIREPLMRYRVHGKSMTDALRHRQEEAAQRVREKHAPALGAWRIARMTSRQRVLFFNHRRQANLDRIDASSGASIRIALANPFLVVGGSDHLMQQVFSKCASFDANLLVYSTLEAPASMGSSADEYARLTPDVFELTKEFPAEVRPAAIIHLLRSRRTNLLMLVGSRATYELLPRIRKELPGLRVVDHLYNTSGHLASNREFARYIDFHIVANEEVQRALVALGESPERIRVIHHGIDLDRFEGAGAKRSDDLGALRLRPDARLVLFAGRLSEEKGALRFLDIAAQLRYREDVVCAMIGDGPLRSRVDAYATALGLGERVPRLGFVDDTRPYLRRADVVVIPSDIDGLPLVSLEALASGTPVVASRVGALPDVVEPGRTGAVVEPSDVTGFARAVEDVLALERVGTAQACRAAAAARFGIEQVREQYFEVFHQVLSEARGARKSVREVA
jgi:glycosyltransferase involved in cell wall biosynthesis